jgi:hypothetical protein
VKHRLLDFEDKFQKHLNEVSDEVAPGLVRCGRILSRLNKREKRAKHTSKGRWKPRPRPELEEYCEEKKEHLREIRNADPRWKEALGWAEAIGEETSERKSARRRLAKDPSKVVKRKKEKEETFRKRFEKLTRDETDEEFEERKAKRQNHRGRRDHHRYTHYSQRRCHYDTWNGLLKSVDQAVAAVITRRAQGLPADWNRPKRGSAQTLFYEGSHVKVVDQDPIWWTFEVPLFGKKVGRFKAKIPNWHNTEGAKLVNLKLTRRMRGRKWLYSVSVLFEGVVKKSAGKYSPDGTVALDWGHREHGHPRAKEGMRVFTWMGDDGRKGEILLPAKCRELLDVKDSLKSRADKAYDARKEFLRTKGLVPPKNRYTYRRKLERLGCVTEEQAAWLAWEARYNLRIRRAARKAENIREETYYKAIIELRKKYKTFAIEDEENWSHKKRAKDEEEAHRKRQNRDFSARYKFVTMCERLGATIQEVPSRNSTKECPYCGTIGKNGPEVLTQCGGCGKVRDKDYGACMVIMKRATDPLANRAA